MSSLRRTLAPPLTPADLLGALRRLGLLSRRRVRSSSAAWAQATDVRACGQELVESGLLTAWQLEQALAGQAARLTLGPYRLLEPLGHGGAAQVYRARHRFLKRLVAVKVLDSRRNAPDGEEISPKELLARFRREAAATSRLDHPGIVHVHDAASAGGTFYLVMELIDGVDLQQLVRDHGPLPADLACAAVRQAALALNSLHEHGLVHRDVKPANLMMVPDGPNAEPCFKLLDFGLACLTERPGSAERLEGTVDYLAPERGADPGAADPRSDLYALGCTLHFLLTGDVVFPGGNWTEKLLRHRLDPPPSVQSLRPDVPAALSEVVARLLAKEPADRYPDAGAVAAALEFRDQESGVRDQAAPRRRSRLPGPWTLAALTAVALPLAWLLPGRGAREHQSAEQRPAVDPPAVHSGSQELPRSASPPAPFAIDGRPGGFATLTDAVAAAGDGETVRIAVNGDLPTEPLRRRGGALTLRAASGYRPRLLLRPSSSWDALLDTDAALTVQGIDLGFAESGGSPVPLLHCSAALHLTDCRLDAAGRPVALAHRQGSVLSLKGCRIEAAVAALSVEAGRGHSCRIEVDDCDLHSEVGVSIWSGDTGAPAALDVHLRRCRIDANRALSLRTPPGEINLSAEGSTFHFRETLLAIAGGHGSDRRSDVSWRGDGNHYHGPGTWLWLDDQPTTLRGLPAWRTYWRSAEATSSEEG
jgi:serine/threonine-protein kinase